MSIAEKVHEWTSWVYRFDNALGDAMADEKSESDANNMTKILEEGAAKFESNEWDYSQFCKEYKGDPFDVFEQVLCELKKALSWPTDMQAPRAAYDTHPKSYLGRVLLSDPVRKNMRTIVLAVTKRKRTDLAFLV